MTTRATAHARRAAGEDDAVDEAIELALRQTARIRQGAQAQTRREIAVSLAAALAG